MFMVISKGPGTNKKWVDREISGYAAIKSARASKFSRNCFEDLKKLLDESRPDQNIFGHLFHSHVRSIYS